MWITPTEVIKMFEFYLGKPLKCYGLPLQGYQSCFNCVKKALEVLPTLSTVGGQIFDLC